MEQTIKIHCPICNGFHSYLSTVERSMIYSISKVHLANDRENNCSSQSNNFTGRKRRELVIRGKKRNPVKPNVPKSDDEVMGTEVQTVGNAEKQQLILTSRIKKLFQTWFDVEPTTEKISSRKITRLFYCPVKRETFQAILSVDDLSKEYVVADGLPNSARSKNAKQ